MRARIDAASYSLFTSKSKKEEDWWIDNYPGGRIIHGGKRREATPLFKEPYEVWKAKLSARGFGPKAKSISPEIAEAVFMEIRNAHDPFDPRLDEIADRTELELKKDKPENLSRFQFWKLDACLVELRLGKKGFIGKNCEWRPFSDLDDLLARGVPISFNEANRLGHVKPNVLARDFLEMFRRPN